MTTEILDSIKSLGGQCYTPEEVGIILGLSMDDVEAMNTKGSDLFNAYWGGFYETDIAVRKSIFSLAGKGSSPAQMLAKKIMEETVMKRHYE